jgi:hypothetical protein
MRRIVLAVFLLLGAGCKSKVTDAPVTATGFFKSEDATIAPIRLEGGRCFSSDQSGGELEARCFMRGDLLYMCPDQEQRKAMTRNVCVVWKLLEDRLEASHVEDIDDGTNFNEDFQPKPVLRRQ